MSLPAAGGIVDSIIDSKLELHILQSTNDEVFKGWMSHCYRPTSLYMYVPSYSLECLKNIFEKADLDIASSYHI